MKTIEKRGVGVSEYFVFQVRARKL